MLHPSLKRLLRDLFFFILWFIVFYLISNHVSSPMPSENIPANANYESRSH